MQCLIALLHELSLFSWPVLVTCFLVAYRKQLARLVDVAIARVHGGASFSIGFVTMGQAVGPLKEPASGEMLTDDHLALIHRSWRAPEHDARTRDGNKMFRIHVITFGTADALQRVERVVYLLDKAYPNPVQPGGPREKKFPLNELANGYSLIRAEVFVRGQIEPVRLSRFLDLTDASPRLKDGGYLD